uniref:Uncharacterized protein LOC101512520 n=2 Tax=Cicer arietinum TaxID=3827 RepID=A0A3Q7Y7G7_CICAR
MLSKGCGLLPNLHIRNSLSLLNHVAEVGKTNKSSHIRSFSPVPAVKKAWEAIHKNKSSNVVAPLEIESNRFGFSGELPGRLSPFRRSRDAAAGISACRSKPQSPFQGVKLLGDAKETEINKSGNLKFYSNLPADTKIL